MIDVGTGSGVLSIASSLLGAKEIYAYDLDDVAVRVAQENIDMNPGMENIHVATGDLLKGVTQEADVIVANILADILIHLTEDAYRLVKDEGYLIMSGIISENGIWCVNGLRKLVSSWKLTWFRESGMLVSSRRRMIFQV